MLPHAAGMRPGVFCFNPPYGVRIGGERGEASLLDLYAGVGRALSRFKGWRAACFVANARFAEAFGLAPKQTKPATNAELRGAFLVYDL
jgi:23S rRNA G2445 N2-methylase RlmL